MTRPAPPSPRPAKGTPREARAGRDDRERRDDRAGRDGRVGRAVTESRPARRRPDAPRPSTVTYRRRRLLAVVIAAAVVLAIGLGVRVVLYDSGWLDAERVQITGLTTITAAAVQQAAAVPTGVPLAEVDTAPIAARVAALPGVATVSVKRSWPRTVTVTVTERVAVASIATATGVALVDRDAIVYPGTPAAGVPRLTITAAGPADASARAALAALAALPDAVRRQVRAVTVDGAAPGQVTFGLDRDRRVLWGTVDRSAEKAAVLGPLLTQGGRVYDVTSPDLPTIRG